MRVIVVGAGTVGYDVARLLSLQRHDVTVVDRDAGRVDHVRDTLDVLGLVGSGTSAATLAEARVAEADLLVAVTDVDEVNVIAAMMAERAGRRGGHERIVTIARVRSGEFSSESAVLTTGELGIDVLIHPEESTAAEVTALLRRAAATDVLPFADGRVELVGLRVDAGSPVAGLALRELAQRGAPHAFRVAAIARGMRTIVPDGAATVQARDQVFVLVPAGQLDPVVRLFGDAGRRLSDVMILGGSKVGALVAASLVGRRGPRVKLVEADRARAEALAERLPGVLVLHGDPSDLDLLAREGVGEMDAVAALTPDEEANLVSCLVAKHLGVRKTIALLSKSGYIPIAQTIGLDAAVSEKLAVSREVLRFVRGTHVHSVATVQGLDAEILELQADAGAPITRAPLAELGLPRGVLLGAVVGRRTEIATGTTRVRPGDRAIVIATAALADEVEPLFTGRPAVVAAARAR